MRTQTWAESLCSHLMAEVHLHLEIVNPQQLRIHAAVDAMRAAADAMESAAAAMDPADTHAALRAASKKTADFDKALDAIIVAIGIVAVLITNVAYVGYVTPPTGGDDAYWVECGYIWFVLYIVFNGFAMVFSTAAIVAVTFGPFFLVRWQRESWRKDVVNVGLTHLSFSLLTLLAAFASAGFIVAVVKPPAYNCGYVKCGDGGYQCALNESQASGAWGFQLDPQVQKLNYAPTGVIGTSSSLTCCNFNYISDGSAPWQGFASDSQNGDSLAKGSCFVLVSMDYVLSNTSQKLDNSSITAARNGYTTWCINKAVSCSVPINFQHAFDLYSPLDGNLKPPIDDTNAYHDYLATYGSHYNFSTQGTNLPSCDVQPELAEKALSAVQSDGQKQFQDFAELLPTSCISDVGSSTSPCTDKVSRYLRALRANDTDEVSRCQSYTTSYYQIPSSVGPPSLDDLLLGCHMLWEWQNYADLRYNCQQHTDGQFPTLCDYGDHQDRFEHPLAIDVNGSYLTKKDLVSGSPTIFVSPFVTPTTLPVQWGVIVMLIVAGFANAYSYALLAYPMLLEDIAESAGCASVYRFCAQKAYPTLREDFVRLVNWHANRPNGQP